MEEHEDEFDVPDHEGFEAVLSYEVVKYKGMLLTGGRSLDLEQVDEHLSTMSAEMAQKSRNHIHLFMLATNIDLQREWAGKLVETWCKTLQSKTGGRPLKIGITDDGEEVIAEFWV